MLHGCNIKVQKGRSFTIKKGKRSSVFKSPKWPSLKRRKSCFEKVCGAHFNSKEDHIVPIKDQKVLKMFHLHPYLLFSLRSTLLWWKNTGFLAKIGKTLLAMRFCELHYASMNHAMLLLMTLRLGQSNLKFAKTHPKFKLKLEFLFFSFLSSSRSKYHHLTHFFLCQSK